MTEGKRRPTLRRSALSALLVAAVVSLGCQGSRRSENQRNSEPSVTLAPHQAQSTLVADAVRGRDVRVLDLLPGCDIDHDGLMIDFGAKSAANTRDYNVDANGPPDHEQAIDRAGSTFLPVSSRRAHRDFWLDEPADEISVRARVAGRQATGLSVWIDGRRLGRTKLTRNEISLLNYPRFPERLEAGRHSLMLESHGRASNPPEPWFEIDWLQLRRNTDKSIDDTAPTLRDIVADQEIDGVPRRSIVLRSATKLRCPVHLSGPTQLTLALGFWGSGRGTADIRIVEDGQPPTTLQERKLAGGNGARWTPVTLDLGSYAGRVVALELRATSATQGGRVVFGEPTLTRRSARSEATQRAKTVVVVLAAGLDRRLVPPWGPPTDRAALADLRRDAIAFDSYRTPTTVPAGVVASLLSGVSPMIHRVEDTAARLSRSTHTLSEVIKQAGGRTAMFTGVPTTFSAFGFNASWDDYASFSPVVDLPAETPLVEASRWLARELDRSTDPIRFVFVHARGAHPPWDLTKEQTAQLEPQDYGGSLDARRAGVTLGRIRRQTSRVQRRLNDEDHIRLRAFMSAAFSHQVAAINQIIDVLKRRNAWDDTLLIFAGDTTNGDATTIPFDPVGSLREDQLSVPLLVKFPKQLLGGTSFAGVVSTADLTQTILASLGLSTNETIEGVSLFESLSGLESPQSRTFVATLGRRYASRTGVMLLTGELGHPPRLCQTDVDPMCVEDRVGQSPLTARALWMWTAAEILRLRRGSQSKPREPASIDPETAAALTVWGDIQM